MSLMICPTVLTAQSELKILQHSHHPFAALSCLLRVLLLPRVAFVVGLPWSGSFPFTYFPSL